jgi:hypothetical protein
MTTTSKLKKLRCSFLKGGFTADTMGCLMVVAFLVGASPIAATKPFPYVKASLVNLRTNPGFQGQNQQQAVSDPSENVQVGPDVEEPELMASVDPSDNLPVVPTVDRQQHRALETVSPYNRLLE